MQEENSAEPSFGEYERILLQAREHIEDSPFVKYENTLLQARGQPFEFADKVRDYLRDKGALIARPSVYLFDFTGVCVDSLDCYRSLARRLATR